MKTTALALVRTVAIWLAFAAITLIYLFGVSAMKVVDFVSHESFASVCGRVLAAGAWSVDFSYHGWILAGAFIALLVHTFSNMRVRLAIAALCRRSAPSPDRAGRRAHSGCFSRGLL